MAADITPLDAFRHRLRRRPDPFRRDRPAPKRPPSSPAVAPRREPRAPKPDDPPPAA